MELTAKQILLEAAQLLSEEGRWGKFKFFQYTENGCQMCAHGAIIYCAAPQIRKLINEREEITTVTSAMYFQGNNYELQKAQQMARKAGISYAYNDMDAKTKEDVIAKLLEAANSCTEMPSFHTGD